MKTTRQYGTQETKQTQKHTNTTDMDYLYTSQPTYTSQQDFGPRKVYCVSNVTFHAESKYVIKIFPSPTVFVQWNFVLLIF
jgi:hypothetical protein